MEFLVLLVGAVFVLGVVKLISDSITNSKLSTRANDPQTIQELEQRVVLLEEKLAAQEQETTRLAQELEFTTKLIEKRL